jgi:glycosyltransferase involved in cell wall biosynthesis
MKKKISIVIPAYNEAKTIRKIVETLFSVPFQIDFEVVIVDDYSRDRTSRIIKILKKRDLSDRIRIIRNEQNHGKGYCLQKGFKEANGDFVIAQDADLEYEPRDITRLLNVMLHENVDVVLGSRFKKKWWPQGMAFPNFVANKFLTWFTNLLFGSRLTDMETCYKLMRKEALSDMKLECRRFDTEPEVVAKLIKKGARFKEIPISYNGRTAGEGKKIKAVDFFVALKVLVNQRFFKNE